MVFLQNCRFGTHFFSLPEGPPSSEPTIALSLSLVSLRLYNTVTPRPSWNTPPPPCVPLPHPLPHRQAYQTFGDPESSPMVQAYRDAASVPSSTSPEQVVETVAENIGGPASKMDSLTPSMRALLEEELQML